MIEIHLKGMSKVNGIPVTEKYLTNTAAAVQASVQLAQSTWLEYISGVTVRWTGGSFVVNRVSGTYQQAVQNGVVYPDHSPLAGSVVVNLDYADVIERGIGTFKMKDKMLRGRPYVNVPFDQTVSKTPTAIQSAISGGRLKNVRVGDNASLKTFNIGQRSKLTPSELGMKPSTWKTGSYAGMADKGGRGYMTFRRISQNTPEEAWIFPQVQAKPVTRAVEENIEDKITELITKGFEQDIGDLQSGDTKAGDVI